MKPISKPKLIKPTNPHRGAQTMTVEDVLRRVEIACKDLLPSKFADQMMAEINAIRGDCTDKLYQCNKRNNCPYPAYWNSCGHATPHPHSMGCFTGGLDSIKGTKCGTCEPIKQ
jgi:hypothetical protein